MPKKGSALGVARARFVEGLPRKAKELKAAMALLVATPEAERPREEMRRRMHALYASAQVFRLDPLAAALKEAIERLDAASAEGRGLSQDDLDALAHLGATLPGLAGEADAEGGSPSIAAPPPGTLRRSSRPPRPSGAPSEPSPIPQPKRPQRTIMGMAAAPPSSSPPPDSSSKKKSSLAQTMAGVGPESPEASVSKTTAPMDPSSIAPPKPDSAAPPAQKKKKKKPATMIGLGAAPPADSTRAPSIAPSDDTRSSSPEINGAALGRVKLQKVPASQARSPSQPPPPGGSFTAARGGSSSRPPLADGDIFRSVVSVLVVDRAASQARIRAALPSDRFEILAAADPEEALRLSRSSAPDLVLIDREIAERSGAELIARLRSDPLTDLVPIALLHDMDAELEPDALRELGADAQIVRDGLEESLANRLESMTALGGAMPSAGAFGDATLEEVADRIAKEIHRGIVDAAVHGQRLRIPLGEGSDLLAAAWATIAKVRAELAEASDGQVRFRDRGGRGGPAFVSLVAEGSQAAAADELEPVSLEGVRIVVADDDPAVVWFFAGLFREEGAVVVEVEDGEEALEAARKKRPDLIVSDILMPRMDGLMLCRHLERDPALAEVPVILISWKEDFLQRMRELRAGASGYLRKEAASAQILQRVREVLRPRLRLESALDGTDEVRGRVEGIGVIPLLNAVSRLRSDARVTVRDAWNLYEVDIRGSALQDVTRTATDGSFARGRRALTQLLGVTAGRFTVTPADTAIRASLPDGDSDQLLAAAAAELGAHVDAVSGKQLAKVAEIRFDEDVSAAFARTSPPAQRAVVDELMGGTRPRDLLVSGRVEPHVVEEALVDLARRGALLEVRGVDGEDLVATCLEARGGAPITRQDLDVPAGAIVQPDGEEDLSLLEAPTNAPPSTMGDSTRDSVVGLASPAEDDDLRAPATTEDVVLPIDSDVVEVAKVHPPPKPPRRSPSLDDAPTTVRDAVAAGDDDDEDELETQETEVAPAPAAKVRAPAVAEPSSEPAPKGLGVMGWMLLIAFCGVVGFFGWRVYQAQRHAGSVEPADTEERTPPPEEPEETAPMVPEEPEEPASAAEAAGLGFGETVDAVVDPEVPVAEGEGLLVVREPDTGDPVQVVLRDGEDERELGNAPISIALPEGRHRLLFRRGEREQFRYLYVGAGQTRVVDPDTM